MRRSKNMLTIEEVRQREKMFKWGLNILAVVATAIITYLILSLINL